jgi:uncharacterized protein
LTIEDEPGSYWGMTARHRCTWRPTTKCRPGADDAARLAAYRRWRTNKRSKVGADEGEVMDRTCPACSARLDRQAQTCPQCGANLAASANEATPSGAVDQEVRNTAVAAHLSTFAGLVVPFGSVIGPLAVWLTQRHRDPFIDDAGREALNFGISIAVYVSVAAVAALMLVGIPLLIFGLVAWVVLASLAAIRASQGQAYRYPLTMRFVR